MDEVAGPLWVVYITNGYGKIYTFTSQYVLDMYLTDNNLRRYIDEGTLVVEQVLGANQSNGSIPRSE
jgi:hypothetical protein